MTKILSTKDKHVADEGVSNYLPNFPHGHYHSYEVRNRELTSLNDNFQHRAEDIALICNLIGSKSVVDIGSNLGGFIFYMEKMGHRSPACGIDGDRRFVDECRYISSLIDSRATFKCSDIMKLTPPTKKYDTIILQNVYHYIYDKIGDHEEIFRKFAEFGRSIIWYNPMDESDAVIPKHAKHNKDVDWSQFTRRAMFEAAIKAGFLHPIPVKCRFVGMGKARQHWLFILDEIDQLTPRYLPASMVCGDEKPVRPHFVSVHKVFLDGSRSYKIFHDAKYKQAESIKRAISMDILDRTVCDTIDFIVDANRNIIGYSQPQGVDHDVALKILGNDTAKALHRRKVWTLLSRMLRHGAFMSDIGVHNFVFPVFRLDPIMIDVENIVFDAATKPQLSIYRREPNENEVNGAENNLGLIFRDIETKIAGNAPIDVLWDCLEKSTFLCNINLNGVLDSSN